MSISLEMINIRNDVVKQFIKDVYDTIILPQSTLYDDFGIVSLYVPDDIYDKIKNGYYAIKEIVTKESLSVLHAGISIESYSGTFEIINKHDFKEKGNDLYSICAAKYNNDLKLAIYIRIRKMTDQFFKNYNII